MTWLGGWLKEIILVVLLASFVEMLLPSKSMERYARLVLSLLVLLTMLSPIVSLLKGDAISELSLAMDQQSSQGGLLSSGGQGAGTLQQILADGQKLAQGQQKHTLEIAANEIAGQMKDQIIRETGGNGVQVTVALAMKKPESPGTEAQPAITSVTVQLPEPQATADRSDDSEPIVISPVKKIEINIATTEEVTAKGAAIESDDYVSETDQAQAKAILKLLETRWGLEAEVIKVRSSKGDAAKL
ncbi:stage III sporulation protein AF [Paenibacillus wynnii]|uniref:stage III sporulation protein AF n=1 Tax=Paenibacillus wynnii TaxID=268407 RepID=UPI00278DC990|nr:stage III sporulation protein AF [Paenibacillus wynnii]MDQ0194411.1 stage III sporulation protein AF [Paenibacillus wynnii]